ncbi:phenylacetate--CoA ligase family protein [uncultured Aureimonas sp.]|uniref:phenylacetate--CoA ligase family protein n=1 Tax=uncultured Aureimonas sp. TaxID=1604662 RepID=UPI0025E1B3E9|nr:AMP-binding protein [uncultured Aureimonas sp.]
MTVYDRTLARREPAARAAAQFATLRTLLAEALARAPGWQAHLGALDPATVTSREALARLPVLRKSDLPRLQDERPPFGGLALKAPGALARLFVSPGPILDPEGFGADWWGAARALDALGLEPGDVLHNSFSYHLTPAGAMFESGAHALGCAVIPAGTAGSEAQVDALARYGARAYVGTPDFLKVLLDKATELGRDVSSLRLALVSGAALPASLKRELEGRGLRLAQAYGTADLGIIAFETGAAEEGMAVSEEAIVEIVAPGTGDPVPDGEIGELIVTRLNADYPLFRFATGDLSAIHTGTAAGDSTAPRIRGWMGRADQTTKVRGMFVRPEQVATVGKRHPEVGHLRLVVTREGERDVMTLHAEGPDEAVAAALAETLASVTKLRGTARVVAPGTLPRDGKVIADERRYD